MRRQGTIKKGQFKKMTPEERQDLTSVKATIDTVERLKQMDPDFRRLLSLTQNFSKKFAALNDARKSMVEELGKCVKDSKGDVGEELNLLYDAQSDVHENSERLLKVWNDEFIVHFDKSLDTDKQGVSQFEKDYKKKTQTLLSELRKAEAWSKKAGKKGPEQLQNAITNLTNKMNEIDEFRTEKLKEILEFERRKLCSFLSLWCHVVNMQIETFCEGQTLLTNQIAQWTEVAGNLSLPSSKQQLIEETVKPERTFVEIQTSDGGEGNRGSYRIQDTSSYYADAPVDLLPLSPRTAEELNDGGYAPPPPPPAAYDEPYSGYEEQLPPPPAYEEEYGADAQYSELGYEIMYQAKALYDFVGEQEYELSFNAGDTINIITEDEDGTGWFQGEHNGKTGPFPGNYVERI